VPYIVVIGGPNGAGKTTISRAVVSESANLTEFVNADVIAQGLSGFDPESAAFQAGRIMLERLRELAQARASFAFESTLASRTFAPWIRDLMEQGYEFHLVYVRLASPSLAVQRVRARVRAGGHHIPQEVVRRRFVRSLSNFWTMYRPIATTWRLYDNSTSSPVAIASGGAGRPTQVLDPALWSMVERTANEATEDE
jgi:predicted ABC-type ATPase